MDRIQPELLKSLREGHAKLHQEVSELSCRLQADGIAGAGAATRHLCKEAEAHFAFEEEEFCPAQAPLPDGAALRRMRKDHGCPVDRVRTLLDRLIEVPSDDALRRRLLEQVEAMERHIADCERLIAALNVCSRSERQAFDQRFPTSRRKHPALDPDRRAAKRGTPCPPRHTTRPPATTQHAPSHRSALPVVDRLPIGIEAEERRALRRLAARLVAEEPALAATGAFGPRVASGLCDGPALLLEDHSETALHSQACYDYRSRLLADEGDLVIVRSRRRPAFEAYCRDQLGIGHADIAVPAGPPHLPMAKRCAQDAALLERLASAARRSGRLGMIPYLGTEGVWTLAGAIAAQSGTPVWVAAPGPRLARRVNDKLWFAERVAEVLGRQALPPTYRVFGPAALAGRAALLAHHHNRICIKVPDGTGGAGNLVLDARPLAGLPLAPLCRTLLQRLHTLGWQDRYPLLVGVWEGPVLVSPSVQLWVPHRGEGPPIVEGVFEQVVEDGHFVGAAPSSLPVAWHRRLAAEAVRLACLFQELGYFGRCSLDAVLLGETPDGATLHWIECNGRWGGVSIPMTLVNRLVGDGQPCSFVIVQRTGLRLPPRPLDTVLARLEERLFGRRDRGRGAIFLTADGIEEGTGLHFLVIDASLTAALAEAKAIAALLCEDNACAGSTASAPLNPRRWSAPSFMPRTP